jgi:plastocyanin/DNA-binding beta-propeller fold protein YncE
MSDDNSFRTQSSRHLTRRRFLLSGAAVGVAAVAGHRPATAQDAQVPVAMVPAADRTPAQWMEYLGIQLVETLDAAGDPVLTPKPGDLYFLTNESTTWGATNTRNNAVFFNAKTRDVAAQSNLPDEYAVGFGSHSVASSADGKYVYLPALGGEKNYLLILDGTTLKINKVYTSLGRPHHVNNFTAPDGRELIMVVDFCWNWTGSGIWVLDPAQDNAVVGGMSRGDFSGNPYIASRDVDGKYMYVACPAAASALRGEIEGFLAKINLETWMVELAIPVLDPIWPEVSLDGKTAWVTLGDPSKVAKIDLEKGAVIEELSTGPGPWGARLSYDESKLYVADKGETGGYGQQGITMSIFDTHFDIATNVVQVGKTTDHIILAPDGKEVWATSNADHGIWVVDTASEQVVATIMMPNGGDTHGSTFIQYADDGQGGVKAEVVSSFTGLRGSALKAQRDYIAQPKLAIGIGNKGFVEPQVSVEAGTTVRLTIENSGGTGTGTVTFDSPELGLIGISLGPGERFEQQWTAPAAGQYTATTNKKPNDTLTVVVIAPQAPAETPVAGGPQVIAINAVNFKFDPADIHVRAGQTVHFVLTNGDDEKHNMVGIGEGVNLLSPDVDPGGTVEFDWTAPATPGTYQIVCAYHPAMTIALIVE